MRQEKKMEEELLDMVPTREKSNPRSQSSTKLGAAAARASKAAPKKEMNFRVDRVKSSIPKI